MYVYGNPPEHPLIIKWLLSFLMPWHISVSISQPAVLGLRKMGKVMISIMLGPHCAESVSCIRTIAGNTEKTQKTVSLPDTLW